MAFQIHALSIEHFEDLFELTDTELAARGGIRVKADTEPGFPCRVSLADAKIGDDLILVNFEHLAEQSPYRASHGIYVRQGVEQSTPRRNEIPEVLALRLLSVRGFGSDHLMKEADVIEGAHLSTELDRLFMNPEIDYVHIHNAKQGCFAAKATR